MNINKIFGIRNESEFNALALEQFRFQFNHSLVYREFCKHLQLTEAEVKDASSIPFLPIEFFKKKKVFDLTRQPQILFTSSGTTGSVVSKHYVAEISIYRKSFERAFEHFYGDVTDYCVLALLPSYQERQGSSLIFMVKELIEKSAHPESGFFLHDFGGLREKLIALDKQEQKVLLIGVSFALLDMAENYPCKLNNTIVMETGGMKGRRKELVRDELHSKLSKGFGLVDIHSEYGMTELLSQAYSKAKGIFTPPPWMKVIARDTEDPLHLQTPGHTGGINVIDLANLYSCSFIATQDLGRVYENGSFEVIGRFDHSDIRGCNLMVL